MNDLKSQLKAWAEETAKAYHNLATDPNHPECNLAFYTQSNLNTIDGQPELLILAINSADTCGTKYTYKGSDGKCQLENTEYWHIPDGMTGDKLLNGNPVYPQRDKWLLWKRLSRILKNGGVDNLLLDEKKLVYTNIIYYTTKKAGDIPHAAWTLKKHSIGMIKLLQPKRILCLSIPRCFNNLPLDEGSTKTLIHKELTFGQMNGIPVYGIPHTANRYAKEEMELVGACLGYLFSHSNPESVTAEIITEKFADKIVAFKSKKLVPKQSHIDFEKLKARLAEKFGEPYYVNSKTVRYHFAGHVQLTATTADGGYLGIGAKSNSKDLPDREIYTPLLNARGWNYSKSKVWYECKRFRSFDNIDRIIEELEQIQKEWIKL